jgi:CRISPR/Cas system-associated exonuclease Cas4 (RecB family)
MTPHANGQSGHSRYVPVLPAAAPAPQPQPGELLSPSQVNKYLQCPAAWYFRYLLGMPDPSTSSLAIGRAVDHGICHALRARALGQQLTAENVMDATDAAWADAAAETQFYVHESPEQLAGRCRTYVAIYLTQMPQVIPALIDGEPAVQVPVSGTIGGVAVHGYIDLVTESGTVVDLKTRRDKPGEIPPDHLVQIATYSQLCPHSRGTAAVHYIVKGRSATSTPKVVPFSTNITPADVQYVESIYPAVQEAMRDGLYLPNRNSRLCSHKLCSFAGACEREFGGRVPA